MIVIVNNASWHKYASLNWHHMTVCYLPAYSPDFNPIEVYGEFLRSDFLLAIFQRQSKNLLRSSVHCTSVGGSIRLMPLVVFCQ
ncbi:MAG: hypothetical protein GYA55_03365 [SAR324 cluster bacterium]|uniref:Tc1-like transposase DDE domain-containing protein n=1 Tax=SAR324 cluster bacterium TaxID=2024889 RepID=A0A7X9FQW7_9DELT|nr:hypothetical protein [SAR324 cluster bacterium]